MGLLERIDFKLTLICQSLNIAVNCDGAQTAALSNFDAVPVAAAALPVAAAALPVAAAALPVTRKTVQQVLAENGKLSGNELDANGCYWSADINTNVPAVTAKNVWKKGRNIDDAVYDAKIAEIKKIVASESQAPATASIAAIPGVPAATASVPAVGAVPGVPAATAPVENPLRRAIIELVNVITTRYKVDYDTVSQLFAECGAADGAFASVPEQDFQHIHHVLTAWMQTIDLFDDAKAAIDALPGISEAWLTDIMTQLALGTTDVGSVHYKDIYRLYRGVANYRLVLDTHFKHEITPVAADPMG